MPSRRRSSTSARARRTTSASMSIAVGSPWAVEGVVSAGAIGRTAVFPIDATTSVCTEEAAWPNCRAHPFLDCEENFGPEPKKASR